VYDGGGVAPDLKFESEIISSLSIELMNQFLVFDFATRFAAENPTVASPEEFTISDDTYKKFIAFAKENNFKYESESQNELKQLVKMAEHEKYYGPAEKEFEALKAKLEPNFEKDAELFSEEIKELLKDEIITRYYYQKGAIRAALKDDKGVKKAIDELNSPTAYAANFTPGRVIAAK
jgi:carboxyl-terminal processing protease